MIATTVAVASGVTVYMIVTALMHPSARPTTTAASIWAITRDLVREGKAPWWVLIVVPASELPIRLRFWVWRLLHPTVPMKLDAAVWTVLVVLFTGVAFGVQFLAAETGWPFPVILAVLCVGVTVQQFVATARRVGRQGALRIARFDVVANVLIPMSTWAVAALIGTLA